MSDPTDGAIPEEIVDAETVNELAPSRGRGRPKKNIDDRLRHPIRMAFTKEQFLGLARLALNEEYADITSWARAKLLALLPKEEK